MVQELKVMALGVDESLERTHVSQKPSIMLIALLTLACKHYILLSCKEKKPANGKAIATSKDRKAITTTKDGKAIATSKDGKFITTSKDGKSIATSKDRKAITTTKDGKAIATTKDGKFIATSKDGKAIAISKDRKAITTTKDGKAIATSKDGKAIAISKDGKAIAISKDGKAIATSKCKCVCSLQFGVQPCLLWLIVLVDTIFFIEKDLLWVVKEQLATEVEGPEFESLKPT
ncbi:hypothetical protein STEG23_007250 [Scotinomys teguina]